MQDEMNDLLMEKLQDFIDVQSSIKILQNSINNDNKNFNFDDIENMLEVISVKIEKSINSLKNKLDEN